jgi:hypothetical protein
MIEEYYVIKNIGDFSDDISFDEIDDNRKFVYITGASIFGTEIVIGFDIELTGAKTFSSEENAKDFLIKYEKFFEYRLVRGRFQIEKIIEIIKEPAKNEDKSSKIQGSSNRYSPRV